MKCFKVFSFILMAFVMGTWMAPVVCAQSRSDCDATHGAGQRKIDQERKKYEEKKADEPDIQEMNSDFEKCLQGIYGGGGYSGGGLPPIPDFNDILNGLCKEARQRISEKIGDFSGSYLNEVNRGSNYVKPWTGLWNQDIWNALQ